MEDRLQISQAQVEENSASGSLSGRWKETVFYEAKEEMVTIRASRAADESKDSGMQQTDGSASGDDGDADTVELIKKPIRGDSPCTSSCYQFCMSYRSPDPDLKVTPFAVVILTILFIIYVLNQADRLVLPVAIPSGLRCELSVQDECRNNDSIPSNYSNDTNCIHFNDNEQGLLTGMSVYENITNITSDSLDLYNVLSPMGTISAE